MFVPLANDGNFLWIGGASLAKLNKSTGEMVFYNQLNSPLPNYYVDAIAIDSNGNKWIGTHGGGLVKYDGTTWTVYDTTKGLPGNVVDAVAVDRQGNVWVGTDGNGLARYRWD